MTQFFKHKSDIISWLNDHAVTNYTINADLTVDVDASVDLSEKNISFLPVEFRRVTGFFSCYDNALTSLRGAPQIVDGVFYCFDNQLTSLEFCPQIVMRHFDCSYNLINDFKELPQSVGGDFNCKSNVGLGSIQKITSFALIQKKYAEAKIKEEKFLLDATITSPSNEGHHPHRILKI